MSYIVPKLVCVVSTDLKNVRKSTWIISPNFRGENWENIWVTTTNLTPDFFLGGGILGGILGLTIYHLRFSYPPGWPQTDRYKKIRINGRKSMGFHWVISPLNICKWSYNPTSNW